MYIILLRHGETDFNKSKMSQSGDVNPDINDIGYKQSELTADYLKERFNICKIYSSTLSRAMQTANIISDKISSNINVIEEPKLKESSKKILESNNITKEESKKLVGQRARNIFEKILNDNLDINGDILLVSHGAVIKNLIRNIYEIEEISQNVITDVGNCTLTVIKINDNEKELILSYDNSHLKNLYI